MTEERPEGRDESDRSVAPEDGGDGQEARRGPDPDAPFHGLRSAADIFGAPITEEEWPSRRERREAERAARQAGQPEPEPFTAPASVPASAPQADHEQADHEPHADEPDEPATEVDPAATQAISMPEQLALPGGVAGRVPPPAAVPPVSNAPDPRAITLPTARSDRDLRAAEARAIEDERRRTDPDGVGRDDVDWLGRARPSATPLPPESVQSAPVPPSFRGGPDAQPLGVQDALPPTSEPPTFTELLRLGDDVDAAPQADRPFDWSLLDDQTGEVPTTLTRDAFDTNLVAAESWATGTGLGAEPVEESASAPAAPAVPTAAAPAAPVPPAAATPAVVPASGTVPDSDRADERTTPSGSSWSLSDDAARTGEVFPGDVDVVVPRDTTVDAPDADTRAADAAADADDDLADDRGSAPTAAFSPRSAAAVPPPAVPSPSVLPTPEVPWWEADDDGTDRRSAVPPLVEPARQEPARQDPARQDLTRQDPARQSPAPQDHAAAWPMPDWQTPTAAGPAGGDDGTPSPRGLAPEDIDQSEWQGRETSDTGVIKDLFGTEAIQQLRDAAPREDTSTRMMPAVARPEQPAAAGSGANAADRDNFINEGFARLQNEGRRGKQLLVYGSIAIIVVLLVLVLLITTWIRGNTIDDHPASPSSSPAAALSVQPPGSGG